MKKAGLLALLLVHASFSNAAQEYKAQDWITDGVFTQGIEGPAVDKQGYLYAVNISKQGSIAKVDGKGQAKLLFNLPNDSIGNGIRFDDKGNMYIADYVNHTIWTVAAHALKPGATQQPKPVAFAVEERMNQPNDLAIMDNGILFASDPNWSNQSGNLWRIDSNGVVERLEAKMGTTNGIAVSPDNQTLYVNESVQRKVWRYSIDEQGNISNKTLLIQFQQGGLDGMRTDKLGNLYIARYGLGKIAIVSPAGKLLKEVNLTGQYPTNVAFGGQDGRRVFVTMQKRGAIESFISSTPGRNY
ncbi:SMP-30/gluconolactonase/LRE family protein [Pseudoalteromonas 'SMAR']|uniref:SMP-30/gluconolactonase/LRE family protein n=1 Tax=Pseudoalteromonas 'SMAR' TaxID=3416908 RepID=UPI003AF226B2